MSFLSDTESPCNHLYRTISLYNSKKENYQINESLNIATRNNGIKAQDLVVFDAFITLFKLEAKKMLNMERDCIPLAEVEKVFEKLRTFIENSNEIAEKEKCYASLDSVVTKYFNRSKRVLDLISRENKAAITAKEFSEIPWYINRAAEEKIIGRDIIFIIYLEYIQLLLIQEMRTFNIEFSRRPGLFPHIDWDGTYFSAEEFAINSILEKASEKSMEECRLELIKIYNKTGSQPVLKLWQLFLAHDKIFILGNLFLDHHKLAVDHSSDSKYVLPEAQRMWKAFDERSDSYALNEQLQMEETRYFKQEKMHFDTISELSAAYKRALPSISDVYKKAYIFYQGEKHKYNAHSYDINPVFGAQCLSPEELEAIHIPEMTTEAFNTVFAENLDALLEAATNDDNKLIFKLVEQWLYGNPANAFVDYQKKFCHSLHVPNRPRTIPEADILAYKMAQLKVDDKKPLKKQEVTPKSKPLSPSPTVKKKKVTLVSTPTPTPTPEPVVVEVKKYAEIVKIPPQVAISKKYEPLKNGEKIPFDHRVRDWFKSSPEALKQHSYASLSPEKQEEA
ncbi:MAG: hypothetical protein JSR46_04855 [Verrucomicrobia bacterium]|nr:hypothetical protein [Verrucomicrobiota bacterium]